MPVYSHPVSDLLALGLCDWQEWYDYERLCFNESHVPALVQLATDWPLLDRDDDEMIWAPVHAWRVLGMLATPEARECLLSLLWNERQEDFYIPEYLPGAVGRIGVAVVEILGRRVADPCLSESERILGINALKFCGDYHPGLRTQVSEILEPLLADMTDDDKPINTAVINTLVELGISTALPAIEAAYECDAVDRSILGELDDLENELNLKDKQPLIKEEAYNAQQETMLADFLQSCGDKALTVSGVKGMMFAVANAPVEVPPDRWLMLAFGSEHPQYTSDEHGQSIRYILFNLLKSIQETISSGREVLPEECQAEDINSSEFAHLKEWSHGYGQASSMLMDVWTDVLKHPQISQWEESWSSCMILLNVWSNADALIEKAGKGDGPDIGKMLEAMPAVAREMAVMSHDARKIWQATINKPAPVRVDKPGRNDPCSCGSGKKFKKCCGK